MDTFNASTCYLRQMACESLRELELIYPTLLAEFVNETLSGQPASALPASASSLLRFFQEERSHISQSYALLYLTVLEHAVAEDEEEDVVGGFESPGGNSASLKQEADTEDLLFDGDGESFDRRSSSGNEEVYGESQNSGSDTYSDDGSYGEGEDRSYGASEEERLLGDLSNVESGESSGRDSYFDEELVQNTRTTGQVYAQQSHVSGIPATPVSRVDFLGSPLDDAVGENRRMMEEEEEAAKDDGAAAQPLTTALTASLGNVPTPILREAIAGLVHQLASTIKRPGYNVPEKSAVMIRPVSPSKFLCSHFPPSMLDFADNRPRDAGEDQDLAGQTGGHLKKKKKKKKSRRETSRTFFDSVVKKLTRALSLVLENSTLFSQWGLVHMITKIVPFSRRMGLQPSIFRHHFYGMAFTQSPLLYHIVSFSFLFSCDTSVTLFLVRFSLSLYLFQSINPTNQSTTHLTFSSMLFRPKTFR